MDYTGTANDDKNYSKWLEARDVEIFEANRLDFRQPGADYLGNRLTVGIEGKISNSKLLAAMYLVYPDENPIEYVVDFGRAVLSAMPRTVCLSYRFKLREITSKESVLNVYHPNFPNKYPTISGTSSKIA